MLKNYNFAFILAMDENNLIGNNNTLPWKLPADLKYFKQKTLNKTVLMGRKTCESLPFCLPNRRNIVLTRNINFCREGFEIIHEIEQLNVTDGEIMVIGGALIYQLLMPFAKKIYLTKIHHKFVGDTYFKWQPQQWQCVQIESHLADDKNLYAYDFMQFERKKRAM